MKRIVAGGAFAILLAVLAYYGVKRCGFHPAHCSCRITGWLESEFNIDEACCRQIRESQAQFALACEGHCAEISKARLTLAQLPADADTALRKSAELRVSEAEQHCANERVMQAHRIAAMLPVEARAQYLAFVLPRLRALDHQGAPDVSGSR